MYMGQKNPLQIHIEVHQYYYSFTNLANYIVYAVK